MMTSSPARTFDPGRVIVGGVGEKSSMLVYLATSVAADVESAGDVAAGDSLGVESPDIFYNGHGYRHLLSGSLSLSAPACEKGREASRRNLSNGGGACDHWL